MKGVVITHKQHQFKERRGNPQQIHQYSHGLLNRTRKKMHVKKCVNDKSPKKLAKKMH